MQTDELKIKTNGIDNIMLGGKKKKKKALKHNEKEKWFKNIPGIIVELFCLVIKEECIFGYRALPNGQEQFLF